MDKKPLSNQEVSQRICRRIEPRGDLEQALCRLQDPRVLTVLEDPEEDPTTHAGWGPWLG